MALVMVINRSTPMVRRAGRPGMARSRHRGAEKIQDCSGNAGVVSSNRTSGPRRALHIRGSRVYVQVDCFRRAFSTIKGFCCVGMTCVVFESAYADARLPSDGTLNKPPR
jgi:hypothetical protein